METVTPDGSSGASLKKPTDPTPLTFSIDSEDLRDPHGGREFDLNNTRKNFTWFVLIGFGLTILCALLSAFTNSTDPMLQVLERILPAQSAVVASTIGFYFISRPVDL